MRTPSPTLPAGGRELEGRVWAALREIEDPEMPINLVDLGLIYDLKLERGRVRVELTFTAMGCPASDMIAGDIRERLLRVPGVEQVELEVVWNPPWSSARLTPQGRDALLAWGLAV
jgi:metal-sulfur cluster biosynthetic enzyme